MALKLTSRTRLQVLLLAAVVIAGLAVLLWWRSSRSISNQPISNTNQSGPVAATTPPDATSSVSPGFEASPTVTPFPSSSPQVSGTPGADPISGETPTRDPALGESFVGKLNLTIPVVGVKPEQLLDTFADARSDGRVHDAIDIPAAGGTAVVAVADGEITRLFQSERGGTTIYQLSADKKLIFYYAHLQGYAPGVVAGKYVRQGEVIAYVGDTGNAGTGNFHLHFSVAVVTDPKRYWEGTNINPYPLLRK